ncbi:hypothetical protein FG386_002141 [Cryptosporidium ryanae]|uniref:uncharacterized protein n=1 Tax=Cryptosporidium ryanae TaxID=515981 RepID=UPI00351A6AF5|nr:hypothetical protein FG386_002141 [Cryptosporidium ryanae]
MESRILKFETSTGRLWIAGTYGINKKPFSKKIIQDIVVKTEISDFITLANSMSYSLKVAATLLRGLMLIYDKQWLYLETDLDNLYSRFREGRTDATNKNKNSGTSLIKRNSKNESVLTSILSIDSSLGLSGETNSNNESNSDIGGIVRVDGDISVVLSLDTENFMLDLNSNNIGRIEDLTLPGAKENMKIDDFIANRSNSNKGVDKEGEIINWSLISNEEFIFDNENNVEMIENIGKIINESKNSNSKENDGETINNEVIEIVKEGIKKRVRSLSYLDVELRYKVNKNRLQENELLLNNITVHNIDESNREWDTHKWWQLRNHKNEKEQFEQKFFDITRKTMVALKRGSIECDLNNSKNTSSNIQSLYYENSVIEKHRGVVNMSDSNSNNGTNNADLGYDNCDFSDFLIQGDESHTNNNIKAKDIYRSSLNSSEDARIYSERGSLIFSDTNRNKESVGVRLSAMLDSSSVASYESSPFGFEKNIVNRNSLLNGSNYKASSIGGSDYFHLDEISSNKWSKSGVTTSSGTYNLKTYTVQKFIVTKMKEIRDIKRINKENIHSNNKEGKNKAKVSSNIAYDSCEDVDELSIYLNELLPEKSTSKSIAATFFYHLLVLATYNEIKLEQKVPGRNIKIIKTTNVLGNEES